MKTEASQARFLNPDLALVARLLTSLGIAYEESRLRADDQPSGNDDDMQAAVLWLRRVLVAAEVKDLDAALVPWQRFDPTRLPALISHNGAWFYADDAKSDSLRLTDAQGQESRSSFAGLDGAQVLWMRPQHRSRPAESGAFTDNLAVRLVWQELFRERGWLWQIALATGVINLLAVSTSLFAMQVYDRVVPTMAYATLTTLVVGMTIVVGFDWLLKTVRARILDSLALSVDSRTSRRVYEHLLNLQLGAEKHSLGTLAAQVSSLDAVRQFFSATVVFALVDLPFTFMFLLFISIIGGAVAWVYALLLPIALLLGYITQLRLRRLLLAQLTRNNERQGLLVDTIRGAESIRVNNANWRFASEWKEITDSINRYGIQQRAISSLSATTTSSLSIIAYVSAVVVGVWQIEAGLLTMGGLIACSILGGRIIAPVGQSVQYLVQWQRVRQSLLMVHQVLSLRRERDPDQHTLVAAISDSGMSLDAVRFSYAQSPTRQLNIDELTLKPGDRVLLVGPVGAGKSTLLKVLAGLYRPVEGRVRLGQADLWEMDPLVLRTQIGFLPQNVALFKGTLRSNLCLSGAASDERLLQISEQLGIDQIAAGNPLGMDLAISEGGEGLSGGQRQLVALARVFINQPRIWLLDEPSASLDRDMEEKFWEALEQQLEPEDVLVVSTHRPMMAARVANRVLVMQRGSIVRDGSPENVVPNLVRQQSSGPSSQPRNADVV